MKKNFYGFMLLFLSVLFVSGQQVLLGQDVKKDAEPQKWGPNLKHFIHPFVGYGFVAGPAGSEGSQVRYGPSHDWQLGLRYKFKVAEFYALGLDATLNPQTFYLKQHDGKTLPNAVIHESEKLRFSNFGLGIYNRFNFDKRGNYMGRFLDIGIFGNWLAFSTHIFEDEFEDSGFPGGEDVTVKIKDLNYLNSFHYGLTARVGLNRFVFYSTYRMSDLFNDKQGINFAELPKLVFGIELGLHK